MLRTWERKLIRINTRTLVTSAKSIANSASVCPLRLRCILTELMDHPNVPAGAVYLRADRGNGESPMHVIAYKLGKRTRESNTPRPLQQ